MKISKRLVVILIVLALVVGTFIYSAFDPAEHLFPKCPFYLLTGLKCPGCGSQRAIHQLLHLDIVQAFKYNAFLVLSIPLIVFLLLADILKYRLPKLYILSRNRFLSWGILVFVVGWWILRNIFNW